MSYLYLLTEDDNDDLFFLACLEQLTGKHFEPLPIKRRKGGGIKAVRSQLPFVVQNIQRTGRVDETYFVIVVDNDRSPLHPSHELRQDLSKPEQGKQCRICELEEVVEAILGEDRTQWPIAGAIAVPVEMLESWLLLICHPDWEQAHLPFFARKHGLATQYHQNEPVPDQLKELVHQAQNTLQEEGIITSKGEFYLHCGLNLDAEHLAKVSRSFDYFKSQVDDWA